MLHRSRSLIAAVLVVITSAIVSYAVSASMPDALLAAGSTRYAAASSNTPETIVAADGWEDLPGMTKYITIPSGKTADVMVTFCGEVSADPATVSTARAMVRDALASPTSFTLKVAVVTFSSQCATFYKTNVAAGSPAVKIQWTATGPGTVVMSKRSMIVVVNIH